jgi:cell wall-associated NlpC family hydrolase
MKVFTKSVVLGLSMVFAMGLCTSPALAKTVEITKTQHIREIAREYGTTVDKLKALNKLDNDVIKEGESIEVPDKKLPTKGSEARKHIKVASRGDYDSAEDMTRDIVRYATSFLGTPYVYGGSSAKGFDCSGFTKYVFSQYDIELSRVSGDQVKNGKKVAKDDLLPGDLLFFTRGKASIGHVGIYIGENKFIHSSSPSSGGVRIDELSTAYYAKSYVVACRVVE